MLYLRLWCQTQLLLNKDLPAGHGHGTAADWSYCTSARPCPNQKGDCDNDHECVQDHVCGENNCRDFWHHALPTADCCIPGNLIIRTQKWTVHEINFMNCHPLMREILYRTNTNNNNNNNNNYNNNYNNNNRNNNSTINTTTNRLDCVNMNNKSNNLIW